MSQIGWNGIWSIVENSRKLSDIDTFKLIPQIAEFVDYTAISDILSYQIQSPEKRDDEDMVSFALRCVYTHPEIEPSWDGVLNGTATMPTLSLKIESERFKDEDYSIISGETVEDVANQLTDKFINMVVDNRDGWYWDLQATSDISDEEKMEKFLMEMIRGGTSIAIRSRRGAGNYVIVHKKYWDDIYRAMDALPDDGECVSRLSIIKLSGKTREMIKHDLLNSDGEKEFESKFNLNKVATYQGCVDVYVYDGELDNFLFINGYKGSGVSDIGIVGATHSLSINDGVVSLKHRLSAIDGFEKFYSVAVDNVG